MPLRLALLSRYPPIEGGISAKTYWLARGLASRGHEVHVVTHSTSAGMEYALEDGPVDDGIARIDVHRPSAECPWHIPEDKEQTLSLLDQASRIIEQFSIPTVDSGYLVPYGITGHFAKTITGATHILRHGGSDIEKFLITGDLGRLLRETISCADVVVTEPRHAEVFAKLTSARVMLQLPYVPNAAVFSPSGDTGVRGRLAFVGKVNYFWQHKRLRYIAEIMRHLLKQFECWFVAQGNGLAGFQGSLDESFTSKVNWRPFVHPQRMPSLLNQLDAIFVFESSLPHPVVSNLVVEAIATGVGIITDRPDLVDTYRDIFSLGDDQVLVVPLASPPSAANAVRDWVRTRRRFPVPRQEVSFEDYLSLNEELYSAVVDQATKY
jgi:glycosyltransferase involved in cell wall biosynthesis